MHILIQNYGVKEFEVPLLKTQLLLLPEIAKSLNSRMQLLEMIALFQKLDTKKILVAEVVKLVKLILLIPA